MIPFPNQKYNVIYGDPAWPYENERTGGNMKSGATAHYDVMTIEDICNLPVKNISEKNAVLFLWATTPLLPEALQVMNAWGFKYKTKIVWRKIMSLGMGYWFRVQTEDLLVGVKGDVRAFRCQEPNFIQTKAEHHSKKPARIYRLIERATADMPNPRRIELFARGQKAYGWDAWGNQLEELPTLEQYSL